MSKEYFNLSEGGAGILQAASRIYAAYIASGRVPEGKEKEWMRRALKHAMSFAKTIDDLDDSPKKPDAAAIPPAVTAAAAAVTTDPDDTDGHEISDEAVVAELAGEHNAGESNDPGDTGIELSAGNDEATVSDDDVLAAIMDDEPALPATADSGPVERGDSGKPADPSAQMMDELSEADDDMPLRPEPNGRAGSVEAIGSGLKAKSRVDAPQVESTSKAPEQKENSPLAGDDELQLDSGVLAALADTSLDGGDSAESSVAGVADDEPSARLDDDNPSIPTDSDSALPLAADPVTDDEAAAVEFLSSMADELPPEGEQPANMDDIMSVLSDDAAKPIAIDDSDAAAPPMSPPDLATESNEREEPSAPPDSDIQQPPTPVLHDGADSDDDSDAMRPKDQGKTEPKPKATPASSVDPDESVSPTEEKLAETYHGDDLSFELVDEDIDMNQLIEDAITATEEKQDRKQ